MVVGVDDNETSTAGTGLDVGSSSAPGRLGDIAGEQTGQQWFLFAARDMRDPNHRRHYEKYVGEVKLLEQEGMAHYFQFIPRGELYYKVMAICDFLVLPSLDETQSGTLARIIALNKPYITTAPLEGLTSQTVDSGGGLLFTTKAGLRRQVLRLAGSERLRLELGNNLRKYLEKLRDTAKAKAAVSSRFPEPIGSKLGPEG